MYKYDSIIEKYYLIMSRLSLLQYMDNQTCKMCMLATIQDGENITIC